MDNLDQGWPVLSLEDLPTGVLADITHRAGRRCRTVSKALHTAYGPLACGLRLPLDRAPTLLPTILRYPTRYHSLTTLILHPPVDRPNSPQHPPPHNSTPLPLATHFPSLTSLSLPPAPLPLKPTPIPPTPLPTSLTHLEFHQPHPVSLLHPPSLTPLTSLRSLHWHLTNPLAAHSQATSLSHLPSLQHLVLTTPNRHRKHILDASQWLPALAPLHHLTLLHLHLHHPTLDPPSLDAVAASWPHLHSLSLTLTHSTDHDHDHDATPLFLALSQRITLQHLSTNLTHCPAPIQDLNMLSSLQLLRSFCLHFKSPDHASPAHDLMETLAAHCTLTRLSFGCPDTPEMLLLTSEHLHGLSRLTTVEDLAVHLAPAFQDIDMEPHHLAGYVGQLTRLTRLHLECAHRSCVVIQESLVSHLCNLGQLRELSFGRDGCGLAEGFLNQVPASCLPHLTKLELATAPPATLSEAAVAALIERWRQLHDLRLALEVWSVESLRVLQGMDSLRRLGLSVAQPGSKWEHRRRRRRGGECASAAALPYVRRLLQRLRWLSLELGSEDPLTLMGSSVEFQEMAREAEVEGCELVLCGLRVA